MKSSLLILVGLILGFSFQEIGLFDGKKYLSSPIRESGYNYINPLLECEFGDEISKEIQPFKGEVAKLIEEKITDRKISLASVYFRDLNNGPSFGINEKDGYIPASLLKVPWMITYFKKAEGDPSILKKEIKYEIPIHDNPQFIEPAKKIELGKTYTVEELIERMIKYSDNLAVTLLARSLPQQDLIDTFKNLGIDFTFDSYDQISVKSYASFFRILFNSSYLNRDLSEKALKLLSGTDFKEGITRGVGPNVIVSQKFGEVWPTPEADKQLHDCGIIYYPEKPYLLCIMTRGSDFGGLTQTIRDISYLVFDSVHQQVLDKNNNQ
ncbi:MAG: serine hydrolase [bacterium]|nr:serine hydrolase [bacterium]